MAYLTGQVLTQADIAALFKSGTYTPTLGNMAIGTGGTPINTASYTFVGFPAGGVLTVEGSIKFGTTAPTLPGASNESIALPAGYAMLGAIGSTATLSATVNYIDVSGGLNIIGALGSLSTTTVFLMVPTPSTVYNTVIGLTATVPFTWAINDEIYYRFSVRCTGP